MILRFDPDRRRPPAGTPPGDELDAVIDRLLADETCDPEAVPPDYRPLLRVVRAARAPWTDGERAGEDGAVACFRAARGSARRRRPGRRRIRAVVVVVAVVAGSATSVAARNLDLPPRVGGLAFDLLTARGVVSAGAPAEPHDPAIGRPNHDVTVPAGLPLTDDRRPHGPRASTDPGAANQDGAALASRVRAAFVAAGATPAAMPDLPVSTVSEIPKPGDDRLPGSDDGAAASDEAAPGVATIDDGARAARPGSVSAGPAQPPADIDAAPTDDAPGPPAPARPPDGVPGPPDHASGPPAELPAGPPDRAPGPPDGAPGAPADLPAARPDHAPGPPDHAPGPLVDVPAGPPEHALAPPADAPATP